MAEEELRSFAKERRLALIIYAVITVVGLVVTRVALIGFLVASVVLLLEPLVRSPLQRRLAGTAG